eukprot:2244432-Rhodomonas_salina.1
MMNPDPEPSRTTPEDFCRGKLAWRRQMRSWSNGGLVLLRTPSTTRSNGRKSYCNTKINTANSNASSPPKHVLPASTKVKRAFQTLCVVPGVPWVPGYP